MEPSSLETEKLSKTKKDYDDRDFRGMNVAVDAINDTMDNIKKFVKVVLGSVVAINLGHIIYKRVIVPNFLSKEECTECNEPTPEFDEFKRKQQAEEDSDVEN